MDNYYKIKSFCPQCKKTTEIQEVMQNVVKFTIVKGMWDLKQGAFEVDYGDSSDDFGGDIHYECLICGHLLVNKDGFQLHSPEELYKYLFENDMLL